MDYSTPKFCPYCGTEGTYEKNQKDDWETRCRECGRAISAKVLEERMYAEEWLR